MEFIRGPPLVSDELVELVMSTANDLHSAEQSTETPAIAAWSGNELDNIPDGHQSGYIDRIAGMSVEQTHTAALLCGVIIVVCIGVGLFLHQLYPEKKAPAFADCAGIVASSERLGCYDMVANQRPAGPFTGASPFSTSSRPETGTSD